MRAALLLLALTVALVLIALGRAPLRIAGARRIA
jgi:hypothetical protein